MEFSIRVGRRRSINGSLLASMNQTEAVKFFKKKKRFTDEEIKKAHKEALIEAKKLKGDDKEAAEVEETTEESTKE